MLIRTALRGSLTQIRHVTPIGPAQARGLVATVYTQVERDFGMLAPPLALHSPAPECLAAGWLMLRETLLVTGFTDRATKEAVATGVSSANACPYCIEVHAATLDSLGNGCDAGALVQGRVDAVADSGVREIVRWAYASGARRTATHCEPPRPAEQMLELVGVAVAFQYLNRMVTVFLGDTALPRIGYPPVRLGALRFLGRFMGRAARRHLAPGESSRLLPEATLPTDLQWSVGNPRIAEAFARAASAFEAGAQRSVPGPVRDLVTARLAGWEGQPGGPGRAWVDDAVDAIPATHRPAGRLALLTAMAPYQVDDRLISEFGHDDRALVELTSWASFSAARRVSSWMNTGRDAPSM